jgi:hypothetical protein
VTGTAAEAKPPSHTNPGVVPVNATYAGRSYGEWVNKWWKWALQEPYATNPLLDPTGEDCAVGQSGKVWFLAGTFGSGTAERTCTIPAEKAIFFPVYNAFDSNDSEGKRNFASVLKGARKQVRGVNGSAAIDGRSVRNIKQYNVESPKPFSFTLGPDNIFKAPKLAGTYSPTAGAGIHLLLKPLPPGHHEIQFTGSAQGNTVKVTYHLTVKRH